MARLFISIIYNVINNDLDKHIHAKSSDKSPTFRPRLGVFMSSIEANVFMSSIKEKLDAEGKLPPYYRRYVDDTLIVMPD